MIIRAYRPEDCAQIVRLFYEAVHENQDYTPAQRDAWAPEIPDEESWGASLAVHRTIVAEEDGSILGFGDITDEGYLDRLFVLPAWQRRGIADALCDALEAGFEYISVHASLTARPFFERRGYRVVRSQEVQRRGVSLRNFRMERTNLG